MLGKAAIGKRRKIFCSAEVAFTLCIAAHINIAMKMFGAP